MLQSSGFRTDIYLGLSAASMFNRAVYMIGGLLKDIVIMRSKGVGVKINDGLSSVSLMSRRALYNIGAVLTDLVSKRTKGAQILDALTD